MAEREEIADGGGRADRGAPRRRAQGIEWGIVTVQQLVKMFEKAVIYVLITMMVVVILLAIFDLGWLITQDILRPPMFVLEVGDLLDIFGSFLLILIGVELLETIKAYLIEQVIHVEIVLEVALIAVARKVIVLDIEKFEALSVLSIAALIVTLAVAYYFEKRARREYRDPHPGGREAEPPR